MSYSLSFHPKALEEYTAASIWYEQQEAALGLKFEKTIDNKIKKILYNPLTFAKCKDTYRQAVIKAFPFIIVYKVKERSQEVFISSIYHTSRNPKGKYRRG